MKNDQWARAAARSQAVLARQQLRAQRLRDAIEATLQRLSLAGSTRATTAVTRQVLLRSNATARPVGAGVWELSATGTPAPRPHAALPAVIAQEVPAE